MKKQANSGNERSMKLRAAYEKEKRGLEAQVDKLKKNLETKDAEAALAAKQVACKHQAEIVALQQQLDEVVQGREADRRAYKRARDSVIQDSDEWIRGEIEAVRSQAQSQVFKAKAETQVWMKCVEEARAASDDLRQQLDQENKKAEALKVELDQRCADMQGAEATARALAMGFESERTEWQAKVDQANALRIKELSTLKASHRSQLEIVDSRLQQVVAKKDASILNLRKELSDVTWRLRKFEALVGEGGQGEERPSFHERSSHLVDARLRQSTGGGLLPSKQSQGLLDPGLGRGLSARV